MTRRGLSILAALLLACAIPAAARADTSVVLSNESRDTEVVTGEARVVNGANESSTAVVDQGTSTSQVQGTPSSPTSNASGQSAGTTNTATAPATGPAAQTTSVQQVVQQLFVGLPTGTTVSP
jgi:hypothetical protein